VKPENVAHLKRIEPKGCPNDFTTYPANGNQELDYEKRSNLAPLKIFDRNFFTTNLVNGIEELNYEKPAQEVFADAAMIMRREADNMVNLPLLHILT